MAHPPARAAIQAAKATETGPTFTLVQTDTREWHTTNMAPLQGRIAAVFVKQGERWVRQHHTKNEGAE
jgi:hypothetical protein